MQHDIALLCRALRRHPGLVIGAAWPVMVAVALAKRPGVDAITTPVFMAWLALSALIWLPILITAWRGRHRAAGASTR